ncbi:MAG: glycosyltransferase [Hyphomicrobiales bacterium]
MHNIKPHEKGNPIISKYFWWKFLALVDGLIFLSKTSQATALQERPELRGIPAQVIPRGNFNQLADRSPTFKQARDGLKIPYNEFVYLFFGRLRAYKNIEKLTQEFIHSETGSSRLIIAGDDHPNRTIGDKLSQIVTQHPNILLDRRLVPDEDLLTYISACDVVILPYKEILNSAALLMALSCGRRVVCPNMGTMAEIAEMVGPEWVYTYEGKFEAKILEDVRSEFQKKPAKGRATLPKAFDWPEVANATRIFYHTLHKTPHATATIARSNVNTTFMRSEAKGAPKK